MDDSPSLRISPSLPMVELPGSMKGKEHVMKVRTTGLMISMLLAAGVVVLVAIEGLRTGRLTTDNSMFNSAVTSSTGDSFLLPTAVLDNAWWVLVPLIAWITISALLVGRAQRSKRTAK